MSLSKDGMQRLEEPAGMDESNIEMSSEDGSSTNNRSQSTDTGSVTGRTSSTDEFTNIKNGLARKETKQVLRLRVLVVLILVAAAASISAAIFYIVRSSEIDEFETIYYGSADKIVDALQEVVVEMSSVSALAVAATADSIGSNKTWPLFTMTNFQERAANARTQSGAIFVSINPLVEKDALSAWERYVLSDANSWM